MKENKIVSLNPEQVLSSSLLRFNYIAMNRDKSWQLHETRITRDFQSERWDSCGRFLEINTYLNIKSDKPWKESGIYRGDL